MSNNDVYYMGSGGEISVLIRMEEITEGNSTPY